MIRHPSLLTLSREHHRALVLAKRAAQAAGGDNEAQQAMCAHIAATFAAELEPHFCCEERDLPPLLGDAAGQPLLSRFAADHAALRRLAGELAEGRGELLAEFATLLAAHVRFEERELFPSIEQVLAEPG